MPGAGQTNVPQPVPALGDHPSFAIGIARLGPVGLSGATTVADVALFHVA